MHSRKIALPQDSHGIMEVTHTVPDKNQGLQRDNAANRALGWRRSWMSYKSNPSLNVLCLQLNDTEDMELDQLAGLAPPPKREAETVAQPKRDKKESLEAIPKDTEDAYEECYPDYGGFTGAVVDSDDEDLTHMDSKEGKSRYDFETEEQWEVRLLPRLTGVPGLALFESCKEAPAPKQFNGLVISWDGIEIQGIGRLFAKYNDGKSCCVAVMTSNLHKQVN